MFRFQRLKLFVSVKDGHELPALAAFAPDADPFVIIQFLVKKHELMMQPFLRADEVGLGIADHLGHALAPFGPSIRAGGTGVADVKGHHLEGGGRFGLFLGKEIGAEQERKSQQRAHEV